MNSDMEYGINLVLVGEEIWENCWWCVGEPAYPRLRKIAEKMLK